MHASRYLFLRLFLPPAILLAGGALIYGNLEVGRELEQLRSRESASVKLGAAALTSNIKFITRDLMFLSTYSALRSAIDRPTPANLAHLEEDFYSFSLSKRIYDQIRWLDETGMERVRVDFGQGQPVTVPADKLQSKAQRYYFSDAFRLSPGEVFISPMDLNVEQDKIELPYKPTIRLATPVADQSGRKRGVVMLNYYGNEMLQAFEKETIETSNHSMVTNAQGYWLKSPHPADEWGFMFKRPELSMAVREPAAWKHIESRDSGQMALDDGLWTWETVYPLLAGEKSGAAETDGPSSRNRAARQYFWKSVSYLSADRLNAIRQPIWLKVAGVASLLLGLIGLGSWRLTRAVTLLEESEVKYQTVSKFAYDWETWISPSGQPIFSSSSCERITGRSADAFMANPDFMLEISHPDDRAIVAEHLKHHLTPERLCEMCFRIIMPGNQVRWIEHACLPVLGETGEFLGRRASNRDITARKNAEAQIQQLAFFDVLTGLPNRRLLLDRLARALSLAQRFQRSLAVMFLDLDNFKKINDTLGHDVGDKLLKEVSVRLNACVRTGDTVARQGGDEFIIVLAEIAQADDAALVADKIIEAIKVPVRIADNMLTVSASIGIAVYPVNGSDDAQELMKKADKAMYAAKAAGRNGYRFFVD